MLTMGRPWSFCSLALLLEQCYNSVKIFIIPVRKLMGGLLPGPSLCSGKSTTLTMEPLRSPAQSWAVIQSIQNTMGRYRIERNCTLFSGPPAICSAPGPNRSQVSLVTRF